MTSIRPFLVLKLITIIALATLTTTTSTTAAATGVTCPCDFQGALSFAKKQVKKIGGSFEITECTIVDTSIEANGSDDCRIEFEAVGDECGYEFQCGTVGLDGDTDPPTDIDVDDNSFALGFDRKGLTEGQFNACRNKIIRISEKKFGVDCGGPTQCIGACDEALDAATRECGVIVDRCIIDGCGGLGGDPDCIAECTAAVPPCVSDAQIIHNQCIAACEGPP